MARPRRFGRIGRDSDESVEHLCVKRQKRKRHDRIADESPRATMMQPVDGQTAKQGRGQNYRENPLRMTRWSPQVERGARGGPEQSHQRKPGTQPVGGQCEKSRDRHDSDEKLVERELGKIESDTRQESGRRPRCPACARLRRDRPRERLPEEIRLEREIEYGRNHDSHNHEPAPSLQPHSEPDTGFVGPKRLPDSEDYEDEDESRRRRDGNRVGRKRQRHHQRKHHHLAASGFAHGPVQERDSQDRERKRRHQRGIPSRVICEGRRERKKGRKPERSGTPQLPAHRERRAHQNQAEQRGRKPREKVSRTGGREQRRLQSDKPVAAQDRMRPQGRQRITRFRLRKRPRAQIDESARRRPSEHQEPSKMLRRKHVERMLKSLGAQVALRRGL